MGCNTINWKLSECFFFFPNMHIQGCTLISNLAGKSRKCKTSGLERESIALHSQLPSSPAFVAQLMLSQATPHSHEQAVFPSSFHQEEDTPTPDIFPDAKEKLSTTWLKKKKIKKITSLPINNIFLKQNWHIFIVPY